MDSDLVGSHIVFRQQFQATVPRHGGKVEFLANQLKNPFTHQHDWRIQKLVDVSKPERIRLNYYETPEGPLPHMMGVANNCSSSTRITMFAKVDSKVTIMAAVAGLIALGPWLQEHYSVVDPSGEAPALEIATGLFGVDMGKAKYYERHVGGASFRSPANLSAFLTDWLAHSAVDGQVTLTRWRCTSMAPLEAIQRQHRPPGYA